MNVDTMTVSQRAVNELARKAMLDIVGAEREQGKPNVFPRDRVTFVQAEVLKELIASDVQLDLTEEQTARIAGLYYFAFVEGPLNQGSTIQRKAVEAGIYDAAGKAALGAQYGV